MANVKLKELPIRVSADVDESDLLLIEDSTDSRSITVRELRQLLSVQDKLDEMQAYFQGLFDEFTSNIQIPIDDLYDKNESAVARIASLEDDNVYIKRWAQWLQDHTVLPVNAIFYSYDNLVDPNDILDGDWECVGFFNTFEDGDKTQHTLYAYKRIS